MKWYKKQMDELKRTQAASSEPATTTGTPKGLKQSFSDPKMRVKKFIKPLEKRSRPKTDAL